VAQPSQQQLMKRGAFPDVGSATLFYLRLAFLLNDIS